MTLYYPAYGVDVFIRLLKDFEQFWITPLQLFEIPGSGLAHGKPELKNLEEKKIISPPPFDPTRTKTKTSVEASGASSERYSRNRLRRTAFRNNAPYTNPPSSGNVPQPEPRATTFPVHFVFEHLRAETAGRHRTTQLQRATIERYDRTERSYDGPFKLFYIVSDELFSKSINRPDLVTV